MVNFDLPWFRKAHTFFTSKKSAFYFFKACRTLHLLSADHRCRVQLLQTLRIAGVPLFAILTFFFLFGFKKKLFPTYYLSLHAFMEKVWDCPRHTRPCYILWNQQDSLNLLDTAGCRIPQRHGGWPGMNAYSTNIIPLCDLMMTHASIISWNIGGLNDPLKCTMVSTALRKRLPAVCFAGNSSDTRDFVVWVLHGWDGRIAPLVSPYSRGVLIHRSLDFQ